MIVVLGAALVPAVSVANARSADVGWQPATPLTGEPTTLNVTSDTAGAVAVLWDFDADGLFDAIGRSVTTSFATPGPHPVLVDVIGGGDGTVVHTSTVAPPAPMMPFPVVRLQGRLLAGGVRVTRLTVHAPAGTRVHVACAVRGHGCPRAPSDLISRSAARGLRVREFERRYRAGATIQVFVSGDGAIGKYTSFRVRRRGGPFRRDLCVAPGGFTVTRCPGR